MKFAVKNEEGQYFDVEAPEGYSLSQVAKYATEKLGFKVKSVEHVDDVEERIRQAGDAAREETLSEVQGYRTRIAELEETIRELREELRDERRSGQAAVAEERSRHEETRKLRMKALSNAETSVRDALLHTVAGERKAREDAERRALDARPVIVENVLPDTPRTGWRIEVTSRDANGFVRAMEAVPK